MENNFDINNMLNGMSEGQMQEMFNKASHMINEGNIPDEMKNILSSFSNNQTQNGNTSGGNQEARK